MTGEVTKGEAWKSFESLGFRTKGVSLAYFSELWGRCSRFESIQSFRHWAQHPGLGVEFGHTHLSGV